MSLTQEEKDFIQPPKKPFPGLELLIFVIIMVAIVMGVGQ